MLSRQNIDILVNEVSVEVLKSVKKNETEVYHFFRLSISYFLCFRAILCSDSEDTLGKVWSKYLSDKS